MCGGFHTVLCWPEVGVPGGDVGCVYNRRNGNNPASVKADITVNLTGYVTWKTRLWRLPVMLRWQTTMPLAGGFFSPEYDELYYELYLGNKKGACAFCMAGEFFSDGKILLLLTWMCHTRNCVWASVRGFIQLRLIILPPGFFIRVRAGGERRLAVCLSPEGDA